MSNTEAETFDTIVKILYIDPLVGSVTITLSDAKQREKAVEGDLLLNPYIMKLDEEIFSDTPIFTPSGEEKWTEEKLSAMLIQLVDKARMHGWSTVQFYKKAPIWRVFSELDKTGWLYDADKNVIGVTVHYGTETDEELFFGEKQCYLLKFKEGNNKDIFAYSDIDQAMWSVATITRQIQSQLDVMSSKPEFYHIVYGSGITPAQRESVLNALDDTSVLSGFAMTEDAVRAINVIKHETHDKLLAVIADKKQAFAGLTRLPLAFYNGERTSGSGTGGAAENVVELKIDRRKEHIFNLVKPILMEIYANRYSITLTDIKMDMNEVKPITEKENEQDDMNGQEN